MTVTDRGMTAGHGRPGDSSYESESDITQAGSLRVTVTPAVPGPLSAASGLPAEHDRVTRTLRPGDAE